MALLDVDMDAFDIGVFKVKVTHADANEWLMDPGAALVDVNSAIDEATSFANDHGEAFVVIRVKK